MLAAPAVPNGNAVELRALGVRRRPTTPRVSVIVPANDEAAHMPEVLPYLDGHHEVVVVVAQHDRESAAAARAALPTVRIVAQTRRGKGNALACGFAAATGDVIVMFEVDGSADPHEIPAFVTALARGADLAKGTRFITGGGSEDITVVRRLGSRFLNVAASTLTRSRFTDLCYGLNAFWADQLAILDLPDPHHAGSHIMLGDGFEIGAMIVGRLALSNAVIVEVPSFEYCRYHGDSHLKALRDGLLVLWTLLLDRASGRRRVKPAGPQRPGWMLRAPAPQLVESRLPA